MKPILLILFVLAGLTLFGQHPINSVLKKQLDSVMILDQKYRDTLSLLMDPRSADNVSKHLSLGPAQAMNHYWALQNRLDSMNLVFIEKVFASYGYPGKTLVDTPTNQVAWFIIQHSQKIKEYMPMMKKAAEDHELPFRLYAMMLDRDLMNNGQEQVYGSQAMCRPLKNGKDSCFIWPIKDAAKVNERRKEAGFDQTVEQNASRMGITYQVITLDKVKELRL